MNQFLPQWTSSCYTQADNPANMVLGNINRQLGDSAQTNLGAAGTAVRVYRVGSHSATLEVGGKRAGLPALIISLAALYFVIANYRLTVAANRPYLVSYGLRVDFDIFHVRTVFSDGVASRIIGDPGTL